MHPKHIFGIITGVILGSMLMTAVLIRAVPERRVTVYIPYGMPALQIAGMLRDEGLIVSRSLFMTMLRMAGGIEEIKAGTYEISTRAITPFIIQKLLNGKQVLSKLTVPEGLTIIQTAELLESKGFGSREIFLSLFREKEYEGYLLPETYVISVNLTPPQIAGIMVGQFNRTFSSAWENQARALGFSKKQIVILASIIEKEAKVNEERPIISAVFHNRLKSHKQLESCATVQYALGSWKKRLSLKDLQIDSPYNTYKHIGLPPGPICSPGRKSLEAALYPADNDALYFIANGDGTHSFYARYSDHIKGKKEYKEMIQEWQQRKRKTNYQ